MLKIVEAAQPRLVTRVVASTTSPATQPTRKADRVDGVPEATMNRTLSTFSHVKNCKGFVTKKVDGEKVDLPCKACEAAQIFFGSLPIRLLSPILQEVQRPPLKVNLRDRLLDQTVDLINEDVKPHRGTAATLAMLKSHTAWQESQKPKQKSKH